MRELNVSEVSQKVKEKLIEANCIVDSKLLNHLLCARENEISKRAKLVLDDIIENDIIAQKNIVPICQDTGIVVCFIKLGRDLHLIGDLYEAINKGIKDGYNEGLLRKSVCKHPLLRENTNDNTPGIFHLELTEGDELSITLCPKGAGSENMSQIKMLKPSDGSGGVKKFVLDVVKQSGGKPCPPIIVGVGIGGNFETCAYLAKKALLRDIDDESTDQLINELEKDLLSEINNLNIGPMGLGGKTTALAVKILTHPCHIASLPVAVNIQCHVSRHVEVKL